MTLQYIRKTRKTVATAPADHIAAFTVGPGSLVSTGKAGSCEASPSRGRSEENLKLFGNMPGVEAEILVECLGLRSRPVAVAPLMSSM